MKICFLNQQTIDVFCGKGWDNWTRFSLTRKGHNIFFHKITGANLTKEDMHQLRERIK